MEREKMIETILHYMCPFFSDGICRGEIRCHSDCIKRSFAEDAVNELIPDGAVVLTREELETTDKIPQKIKEFYKWFIEIEKEQTSKETAREIFKRLCNVEYSIYDDAYGYAGALVKEFEQIFKEYGVEVKK